MGFTAGSLNISFSGIAVGALAGILLNAVLPGRDHEYDEENPEHTGVDFGRVNR